MRKRKVITRSGARVRGYFASFKSRRLIPWESLLERDALLVMEFDDEILAMREFQEQVAIESPYGQFSAYPDFHTELTTGHSEIVEVKADFALLELDVQRRLSYVGAHFAQNLQRYRVLSEAEIRQQPRLSNLELLVSYRRPPWCRGIAPQLEASARDLFVYGGSTTLQKLSETVGGKARALQFIANGLARINLSEVLCMSAQVWPAIEDSP